MLHARKAALNNLFNGFEENLPALRDIWEPHDPSIYKRGTNLHNCALVQYTSRSYIYAPD